MGPEDVGLKQDNLEDDRGHGFFGSNLSKSTSRLARWAQPITYLNIYECESFTVSFSTLYFFLAPSRCFYSRVFNSDKQ